MADSSPTYYTRGSIEVWDFIRDQELNYHLGNVVKYVCRAGHKDASTKRQDLKKAIHYLTNELQYTLPQLKSRGPSGRVSDSLWNPELHGEPDYATGFDR
jgi:hypothetical protein